MDGALTTSICRELLQAQCSDWAYAIHHQSALTYAEQRVRDHVANMKQIYSQLTGSGVNVGWLSALEARNNIYLDMDLLSIYMERRRK